MPFGYSSPFEVSDISVNAFFTGGVTVCFNLPAVPDQPTFDQLRVLHLEGNTLVDRTSSRFFPARQLCATVSSFSPFVISANRNAGPTAANGSISGAITDERGAPVSGVTITLNGTESRETITDSSGQYNFGNVETNGVYSVTPALVNFTFNPGSRSFSLLGMHTEASFTATANSSGSHLNPLDSSGYFVRQQYVDFLNREPDEAGLNFWVNNIEACGADAQCRQAKRIDTSTAFFLSIE